MISWNVFYKTLGYSDMSDALNVTKYLTRETTLMPWLSFVNNMATTYRLLGRTAGFTYFKVNFNKSTFPCTI